MKLKSLHIQNFRALEDFKVRKLGNVNLIVGENNSGKSSVLEALRIYAGNANRSLLSEIAKSHDEKYSFTEDEIAGEQGIPFEAFFTGRNFPDEDGKAITIGELDNQSSLLQLQHVYLVKKEEKSSDREKGELIRVSLEPVLKSQLGEIAEKSVMQAIQVSKNDKAFFIILDDLLRSRRSSLSSFEENQLINYSFVSTKFMSLDELADDWDRKIALTEYADQVKIVLNFIESSLEDIAFVKDDSFSNDVYAPSRRSLKRTAKVKINNSKKSVPLNSMGEGMSRLLQLAIKAILAKDGFLLIDEFENGLHYSVQEKVWAWLFELSKNLNIQIFATTHSNDCINSFNKVSSRKDDVEGMLFRISKGIKKEDIGKIVATEFDEEELSIITKAGDEVR